MNKLIEFETRSEFESFITTNSGLPFQEALSSSNNGVYGSVVFIKDTGEIYANNKLQLQSSGGYPNGVLSIKKGGTGAGTVEDARNNLEVYSKAEIDDIVIVHEVINHGTGDTTFTLTPNTLHVWDEVDSLNISLGAPIEDVVNEYHFIFKTKDATTLSLPTNLKWANNTPLVIEAYKIYSISILNNLIIFTEFDSYIENAITYKCYDGESIDIYSEYPLNSTIYVTLENGQAYTLNSGESQWEFTYSLSGTYNASISFSNNGYIEDSTTISDSTYKYTIPESFILTASYG